MKIIIPILILIIIIIVLVVYFVYIKKKDYVCPTGLVEKSDGIHLEGTNKVFSDLSEYASYVKELQNKKIKCPILKLKNKTVCDNYPKIPYRNDHTQYMFSDFTYYDVVDANIKEDSPFNKGMYTGYDAKNQYNGSCTEIDDI
jgi:hypothetical protein